MLHPGSDKSVSKIDITGHSIQLLIGPEGGFSDNEVQQAIKAHIEPVSCGPRILRTETAGFTAIAILQARFGDL